MPRRDLPLFGPNSGVSAHCYAVGFCDVMFWMSSATLTRTHAETIYLGV